MSTTTSPAKAVVLATHLPDEGHLRSRKHRIKPWVCNDDLDYWRGLSSLWSEPVTIINAEHDMAVTDEHLAALLACPEPLCTWAYQCHWVSTHNPRDVWACGPGTRYDNDAYAVEPIEWAGWSAIGLVKIAPEARIGPLEQSHWSQLELAVEKAVKRPWHVHWGSPMGPGPELLHHHW